MEEASNQETQKIIPASVSMRGTNDLNTSSNTDSVDNDNDVCPVCKGNGWELYKVDARALEDVYGEKAVPLEYARKCRRCNGWIKDSEDLTNVPETYRDADITKFDFGIYSADLSKLKAIANDMIMNFLRWRKNGKGLYLWSETPGTGKSFLASCIGKSVMVKNNIRFKFTTVNEYFSKVGEGMTNRKNGSFDDPSLIYRDCELLVLDDLGTQLDKEWQEKELFDLINGRLNDELVTIFTSNISPDKLKLNDRIKSRITKTAIPIRMPEESIRQKKAKEEQAEFLKGII